MLDSTVDYMHVADTLFDGADRAFELWHHSALHIGMGEQRFCFMEIEKLKQLATFENARYIGEVDKLQRFKRTGKPCCDVIGVQIERVALLAARDRGDDGNVALLA